MEHVMLSWGLLWKSEGKQRERGSRCFLSLFLRLHLVHFVTDVRWLMPDKRFTRTNQLELGEARHRVSTGKNHLQSFDIVVRPLLIVSWKQIKTSSDRSQFDFSITTLGRLCSIVYIALEYIGWRVTSAWFSRLALLLADAKRFNVWRGKETSEAPYRSKKKKTTLLSDKQLTT